MLDKKLIVFSVNRIQRQRLHPTTKRDVYGRRSTRLKLLRLPSRDSPRTHPRPPASWSVKLRISRGNHAHTGLSSQADFANPLKSRSSLFFETHLLPGRNKPRRTLLRAIVEWDARPEIV